MNSGFSKRALVVSCPLLVPLIFAQACSSDAPKTKLAAETPSVRVQSATLSLSGSIASQEAAPTASQDASTPILPKPITIATTPNARCTLSHPSNSPAGQYVWADGAGIVHLWASPQTTSDEYLLTCDETAYGGGAVSQYPFNLADSSTFIPATPRFNPPGQTMRPALADPTSVTQAALIQGGYPPRPDPMLAQSLYAKWLNIVSAPALIIPSHPVPQSQGHFGPGSPTTSFI
jgi:hypothetical protein